ncbi:CHASE domain-containing protein [Kiloniella antarctica]|uniref:histidine kinase n=1 Tax=Kiloniella antarctica TaxID=1550907 RepID=A0ABW5BS16_9PROT
MPIENSATSSGSDLPPEGKGLYTGNISNVFLIFLLGSVYGVTGWVGLSWAIETGYATAIWPPSGIALAAILIFGYRVWPGVFIGSFCANILSVNSLEFLADVSFLSFLVAVGIASGAALQAVGGGYLVHRFGNYPNPLTSPGKIIRFFVLAGPIACILNAIIGSSVLVFTGVVDVESWVSTAVTWWGGDTLGVFIFTPMILVWRFDRTQEWVNRRGPVTTVLIVTFGLTITAYGYVRALDKTNVLLELEAVSNDMAKELNLTLRGYLSVLAAQEGTFHAIGKVTPEQFKTFTNVPLIEFPALKAISWNARFSHDERPAREASLQQSYGPNLIIKDRDNKGQLSSASNRAEYVSVMMIEPLRENFKVLGFDVMSNPVRREALNLARDLGEAVTTGRITLVQEDDANKYGVLIFRPHYLAGSSVDTVKDRRQAIQGYHTGVIDIEVIIKSLFPAVESKGVELQLLDMTAEQSKRLLFRSSVKSYNTENKNLSVPKIQADSNWTHVVNVPGRKWELQVHALDDFLKQRLQKSGWEVLVPGLIITSLIGFLALLGTGRHLELEATVDERTRELLTEIADRKVAEQALITATKEAENANKTKSEFLATMSHEIRTPMTGVIGYADMLLEDELDDESHEKVSKIKDCTKSLLRVLNDILDISKLDAGKLDVEHIDFSLKELVTEVLALFDEKMGRDTQLKVELNLSDDFPEFVNSDSTRIRQVLLNLIGNAFKFTQEGHLIVQGSLVKSVRDQQEFKISVEDTGIGISAEGVPKLFTEFSQADASISRKYEGTGLGLAICKRLIELMGGRIGVESKLGEGSTFWFTLPYVPAKKTIQSSPAKKTVVDHETIRPLNVLIAEDNKINQRIIEFTMEALGHKVELTWNGREALEAITNKDFDLILMDVRMPEMSGPDATRAIRQLKGKKSSVPIIALTADAMTEHQGEYSDAGMDACVAKPIDRVELVDAINKVMGIEIHRRIEAP